MSSIKSKPGPYRHSRQAKFWIGVTFVTPFMQMLAYYWEFSSDAGMFAPYVMAPPWLGAGLASASLLGASIIGLAFRTSRPWARATILPGALCLLCFLGSVAWTRNLKPWHYQIASERGAKIVVALQRYEKEHGEPPALLMDLVPKYLGTIPKSGLPKAPEFSYTWTPQTGSWTVAASKFGQYGGVSYTYTRGTNPPDLVTGWTRPDDSD